jgi:hypothetical protein
MQQQGLAGRQQPQQQQQQQQSAFVTAWQELVVMLHSMRLRGVYGLMPDLVGALEAGDADAAHVFKNVSLVWACSDVPALCSSMSGCLAMW